MGEAAIPGDDILEYYGKAPWPLKLAISDLLRNKVEGYVCLKIDKKHEVTTSVSCSAITGQVMLISVLRNLTKDYGRVWLLQLLSELQKIM